MNISQYAEHSGRSRQLIGRWVKPGGLLHPALTVKRGKNVIDTQKADELIKKHLNVAQSRRKIEETIKEAFPNGEEMSYQETLTLDKRYSAALKKLKFDYESGTLTRKADVEKEAFECGRQIRDAILNVPDRVSAILAAMSDEFEINRLLTKELTEVLSDYAKS